MGSDFSALDAELDTLGAGPVVDALALAATYAGSVATLSDIDAALVALHDDLDSEGAALLAQKAREASTGLPNFLAGVSGERVRPLFARAAEGALRPRADESEEIVLPDPVLGTRTDTRGASQREKTDESVELPVDGGSPRSGSFSLDGAGILPGSRDDTIETSDDELVEADIDLLDLRSESAPLLGIPLEPSAPPLFDLSAPSDGQAQEEADAAFAELFADAARLGDMAATLHTQPPPAYGEDTEIFDSGSLGYVENLEQSATIADTISAEELDSAEFEIVLDEDSHKLPASSPPPYPSQHPSQPPEKRPSFLGRLFGRKEE